LGAASKSEQNLRQLRENPDYSGGINMSGESLLVILTVGLIAGWLAGQLVRGTGFGLAGDLLVGIVGAFFGDWLLRRLGIHFGAGIIGAILDATIGAVALLLVLRLITGRRSWWGWGSR
jgi:uncharacterized membrane protein YeaQ/YmgE (transglycosylase-associated protein family)